MFRRISLVPSLAALLVVILTVNLGAWQLRRADEKRHLAQQKELALKQPALPIDPLGMLQTPSLERRYQTSGRFDASKTVFLDNRTQNGVAGLMVYSPLQLADNTWVLVNRGWIARPSADRKLLPQLKALPEPVTVEGTILSDTGKAALFSDQQSRAFADPVWAHVSLADYALAAGLAIGTNLRPYVLKQTNELPDGATREAPKSQGVATDVDKHLGYAFQWFALALATLLIWLYFSLIRPASAKPVETTQAPS